MPLNRYEGRLRDTPCRPWEQVAPDPLGVAEDDLGEVGLLLLLGVDRPGRAAAGAGPGLLLGPADDLQGLPGVNPQDHQDKRQDQAAAADRDAGRGRRSPGDLRRSRSLRGRPGACRGSLVAGVRRGFVAALRDSRAAPRYFSRSTREVQHAGLRAPRNRADSARVPVVRILRSGGGCRDGLKSGSSRPASPPDDQKGPDQHRQQQTDRRGLGDGRVP